MVEAATRLEGTEHRTFRGNAYVAGQRRLEATRECPTIDGRDGWLGNPVQASCQAAQTIGHVGTDGFRGGPRPAGHVALEVGTSAERVAGSRQDGNVGAIVVSEVLPDLP